MGPLQKIKGKQFFEQKQLESTERGASKNKPTINSVRTSLERNFHPRVGSHLVQKE
jgi:hypothetical protein